MWCTGIKRINAGLARANGDFVAVLTQPVHVTQGWLGRLQWIVGESDDIGLIMPEVVDPQADTDWRANSQDSWYARGFEVTDVNSAEPRIFMCSRAVLETVGGFDVTLDVGPLILDDFVHRVRLAGLRTVRTSDVIVASSPFDATPTQKQQEHFQNRWGRLPPLSAAQKDEYPIDNLNHYCPPGSEEGFRPDVFKLKVLEAEREIVWFTHRGTTSMPWTGWFQFLLNFPPT